MGRDYSRLFDQIGAFSKEEAFKILIDFCLFGGEKLELEHMPVQTGIPELELKKMGFIPKKFNFSIADIDANMAIEFLRENDCEDLAITIAQMVIVEARTPIVTYISELFSTSLYHEILEKQINDFSWANVKPEKIGGETIFGTLLDTHIEDPVLHGSLVEVLNQRFMEMASELIKSCFSIVLSYGKVGLASIEGMLQAKRFPMDWKELERCFKIYDTKYWDRDSEALNKIGLSFEKNQYWNIVNVANYHAQKSKGKDQGICIPKAGEILTQYLEMFPTFSSAYRDGYSIVDQDPRDGKHRTRNCIYHGYFYPHGKAVCMSYVSAVFQNSVLYLMGLLHEFRHGEHFYQLENARLNGKYSFREIMPGTNSVTCEVFALLDYFDNEYTLDKTAKEFFTLRRQLPFQTAKKVFYERLCELYHEGVRELSEQQVFEIMSWFLPVYQVIYKKFGINIDPRRAFMDVFGSPVDGGLYIVARVWADEVEEMLKEAFGSVKDPRSREIIFELMRRSAEDNNIPRLARKVLAEKGLLVPA